MLDERPRGAAARTPPDPNPSWFVGAGAARPARAAPDPMTPFVRPTPAPPAAGTRGSRPQDDCR